LRFRIAVTQLHHPRISLFGDGANVKANKFSVFAEYLSVNADTFSYARLSVLWYYLVYTCRKSETTRLQPRVIVVNAIIVIGWQ